MLCYALNQVLSYGVGLKLDGMFRADCRRLLIVDGRPDGSDRKGVPRLMCDYRGVSVLHCAFGKSALLSGARLCSAADRCYTLAGLAERIHREKEE